MADAPAKRMLTKEEAATYCGFKSVGGFLAYIKVAPVNFGALVRYDIRDLDEYLDGLREITPKRGFAEAAGNAGAHRGH
jgi:hypothetical protein